MTLRRSALEASYLRLEKPLYNVLFRLLWHAEDSQDMIHEAYARLWKRRERIDPSRLDALVWTTALNLARNRLRWSALWRWAPMEETDHLDHQRTPETEHASHELRRALGQLPMLSQQVLLLSEFAGLSGAEMAELLRIPKGTVASRKHHAMDHLRRQLGGRQHG
ncbi:RNA polymerase sigma factor [Oleiagrimonas sp. C23AA]|uniref:RNA polymerase sigma factor n=1 Tax=Oleiagrimonas sp. C23AA TaxID=2719047 RepID=UPI0014222344|nr:RNA polymerase sigma factor [Oleiagrimonas sp. C23AA]NII11909.1 RNA polymerase sigma factor [Oleiagrimonas sp. C23AA]